MQQLRGTVQRLLALGFIGILAACGGGGGGPAPGPTELPESDYVLVVKGEINPYNFDSETRVSPWSLLEILDHGYSFGKYPEEVGISQDGELRLEVDARTLLEQEEKLGPEELARFLLSAWRAPGYTANFEWRATDPNARIALITDIYFNQADPVTGSLEIWSHLVELIYERQDNDNPVRYGRAVFSDRPVTIRAEATYNNGAKRELELNLKAGWNIVSRSAYYDPERGVSLLRGKPLAGEPSFDLGPSRTTLGDIPNFNYYGHGTFAEHTLGGPNRAPLISGSYLYSPNSVASVGVLRWLGFARLESNRLVPFDVALSSLAAGATTSPEANGALASTFVFDEANINSRDSEDRWNPDLSQGVVNFYGNSGNEVRHIYSDRETLLHLSGEPNDGSGIAARTETEGLALKFGWNAVELRPDRSATEPGRFVLHRYDDRPEGRVTEHDRSR